MPLTSDMFCEPSAMNWGANVPAPFRFESERRRVELFGPKGDASWDSDWLRECPMLLFVSVSGDEMRVDFGRDEGGGDPGAGDAEVLAKGELRHRGPFCAGALIVCVDIVLVGASALPSDVRITHNVKCAKIIQNKKRPGKRKPGQSEL